MRILCRIIEVTSFCMRKRSISSTNVVKIHQERNFIRRKTCVCLSRRENRVCHSFKSSSAVGGKRVLSLALILPGSMR